MGGATGRIEFELASEIEYVAGTVNGINTVFIQDEADPVKWRAAVSVSEDNLYDIYLEMYDEAGNVSYYSNVIEYILPWFVFDRTEDDVEYAKNLKNKGWNNLTENEKKEWMAGLKGCLNKSDLKRIENNIAVISPLLKIDLLTYQGRIPEVPDETYFKHLLSNIRILRNSGYARMDTPETPEYPPNTYEKINSIEKILYDIYSVYNSSFYHYCNEIYCNEEIGALL